MWNVASENNPKVSHSYSSYDTRSAISAQHISNDANERKSILKTLINFS